ncbi:MAG: hypothetical protein DHS20C17_10600 [Cyclobacteriaceae bacterium]|nr:MAG: hypothetical protein DHS20C17_10600 [Cyclobacteriaceae bacterium]
MNEFYMYLKLGLEHILDINGYDHILFVLALCAIYVTTDWKKILVLVTAFTVGHSVTLVLATFQLIRVNTDLIELLIPVTILVTALSNILRVKSTRPANYLNNNYILALLFGLIHGMGFSNYLRALLGRDSSILKQLFAFNIGLEVGQIIIVGIFMLVSFILITVLGVRHRDWNLVISSAIAGVSLMLISQANYWN